MQSNSEQTLLAQSSTCGTAVFNSMNLAQCGLASQIDTWALWLRQNATQKECISHTDGSARVLQGRRRNSKGKRDIRPLVTPKPLNRSSPKVAYVIRSWISTDVQNLVAIPPGVSFPRMREIAHQNVYSASFLASYNAPQTKSPN